MEHNQSLFEKIFYSNDQQFRTLFMECATFNFLENAAISLEFVAKKFEKEAITKIIRQCDAKRYFFNKVKHLQWGKRKKEVILEAVKLMAIELKNQNDINEFVDEIYKKNKNENNNYNQDQEELFSSLFLIKIIYFLVKKADYFNCYVDCDEGAILTIEYFFKLLNEINLEILNYDKLDKNFIEDELNTKSNQVSTLLLRKIIKALHEKKLDK